MGGTSLKLVFITKFILDKNYLHKIFLTYQPWFITIQSISIVMLKLFVASAPEQFKYNLEDSCSPLEQVPDI